MASIFRYLDRRAIILEFSNICRAWASLYKVAIHSS